MVWPFDKHLDIDRFDVVPMEPDSAYFCILPRSRYCIHHEAIKLIGGETITTEIGRVYISSMPISVGNAEKPAYHIISCEKQPGVIRACGDGVVNVFWASPEPMDINDL